MEYKDLINSVVEAIRAGKLSMADLDRAVNPPQIPEVVVSTMHILFCTNQHSKDHCTFYEEINRVDRQELPAYKKWVGLVELYLETFDSTIEDLRKELSFLKDVLYFESNKPKKLNMMAIYITLFMINQDPKLLKFVETFVEKLNKG